MSPVYFVKNVSGFTDYNHPSIIAWVPINES
jgi:hypothetical protein